MLEDFTKSVLGPNNRYRTGSIEREHLFKYLPTSQAELPPRRMQASPDNSLS